MKKMIDKFGPTLSKLGNFNYKTPGTPGFIFLKPINENVQLSSEDQTIYRSGVGTLLQFSNKTRPDIANPVRELSRGMDKATPAAMKEMYRIMKYLVQTKDYGLKIAPTNLKEQMWNLTIYSDSDWASNKDDRKSITGFAIFLQGAPILWRSQAQKTVALSSTEAEYYATAEAAKEIKFIVHVLETLNIPFKKPIIVHIDNVGAIFVAENPSATKHTRHIDARYHFVREYIIDGTIKIIFVTSKDNKADIFTKNVNSEIFEEHNKDFIVNREVIELTSAELDSKINNKYFSSGGVSGTLGTRTDELRTYNNNITQELSTSNKYKRELSNNNKCSTCGTQSHKVKYMREPTTNRVNTNDNRSKSKYKNSTMYKYNATYNKYLHDQKPKGRTDDPRYDFSSNYKYI